MLEKELEIFEQNKSKLRDENSGAGYVVIKGDEILGVWNSRQDALREGIKKFGNVSFLVKDIADKNDCINFSRNLKFV